MPRRILFLRIKVVGHREFCTAEGNQKTLGVSCGSISRDSGENPLVCVSYLYFGLLCQVKG